MVEEQLEPLVGERVQHLGIGPVDALVEQPAEEVGRQHDLAAAAKLERVPGECHGLAAGAGADAHQQLVGRHAGGDERSRPPGARPIENEAASPVTANTPSP